MAEMIKSCKNENKWCFFCNFAIIFYGRTIIAIYKG